MGALADVVKKACDKVVDEALDHYEERARSMITEARVKQIRNQIIQVWWTTVDGKDPSSTQATSVPDPINIQRGATSLTVDIKSYNEEGLFWPKTEGMTAYQNRNADKTAEQSKDGATIPIAYYDPAHYIFNQIFFDGRLGPEPPYKFWYHRNWPEGGGVDHSGTPLATFLIDPARWGELQHLLDMVVGA